MKSIGLLLCFTCGLAYSQIASVKGRVLDASTSQPLPFCNVFINGTTFGTTSDADGNFELKNVPMPGQYEVIFSYVGYESTSQKIDVSQSVMTLRVMKLTPSQVVLNSVEVNSTRDKAWDKKLGRFSKIFLGTDKQSSQCTITNPWVIDFPESNDNNLLVATASEPIVIENKALGYKVRFLLMSFVTSSTDYSIYGKSFFEELTPENDQQAEIWKREREESYRNSKQYLFKSIVERKVKGEGFRLFMEVEGSSRTRSPFFAKEVGKSVLPADTLNMVVDGPREGVYGIRIPRRLEVHNMGEKDISSVYRDVLHPISWIESKKGIVYVTKDGFEIGSDAATQGVMNDLRMSRLVPTDYIPGERIPDLVTGKDFSHLHERIYVQTDKPYYYEGETLWFKGYIKYGAPALIDSMSTTVYAELIDADKKIIDSKVLEITGGTFYNEFVLPDSIRSHDYFLRFYTRFNRNFGDDRLYTKYIPILKIQEAVDPVTYDTSAAEEHKTREKIDMVVQAEAYGNVSISVTDISHVVPVETNKNITQEFLDAEPRMDASITYPIEYGFGFRGVYTDRSNTAKEELLHVFHIAGKHHTLAQSDRNGIFSVNGYSFYDSAYFALLPNKKNKTVGIAKILPQETPPVYLPATRPTLHIRQTGSPQRSMHYKTNDLTVLKEVTVTATRIREEKHVARPFGQPDQVLTARELNSKPETNMLMALQGKLHGLMITQFVTADDETRWLVYLARSLSISRYPPEVLVTVNDNVMSGRPEDILTSLRLSDVVSVEISRRNSVLYGRRRTNGILAIYTDPSQHNELVADPTRDVLVYGYRKPRAFQTSDYSLIYWNPDVMLDENGQAKVTFMANDQPGKYRVVIEGISPDGAPIYSEKIISVTD